MASPITLRPVRRMTQAELDAFLEVAANILRGNVDHSEFRGYVFALLFYKRISDVYLEEVRRLTAELGDAKLARLPKMHNFVVPEEFLWSDPGDEKKGVSRKSPSQLGQALNDAMLAIERANQPKFDGILTTKIDFNNRTELPQAKLVSLINHFSTQPLDKAHVPDDLFGNAYEYLVRTFASRAGKSSGEFYTPKEVAFLLSEMVEPAPGHSICDWASGSGGLLLQCRRYVQERGGNPDQLFLYSQESNVTTYNISRINMILHGVRSWNPEQGDSLRTPLHLDDGGQIKRFDRVLMNPPFSLEDWGYDDVQGGDPYNRFGLGLPPRNNGDYAWLQHVVKSLKDTGRAIVVMSQGVLFRGQPEQTEEEDGQNQKADAEYVIREGFIERDLIECVVVLPSKLFYGNSVPGCLVVLNKSKTADRKNKILLIWASRNVQKSNPQNLLRPSDLMRILVPWRAFGELAEARRLVGVHEKQLVDAVEAERASQLKDIAEAYDPVLAALPALRAELSALEGANYDEWALKPSEDDEYFSGLLPLMREIERLSSEDVALSGESKADRSKRLKELKAEHRTKLREARQFVKDRLREVKRTIKLLSGYEVERDAAVKDVNNRADREAAHLKEAAADLLRICSDPEEAKRYFTIAGIPEIEENEFNLNLPRYVDTFEPEELITLEDAVVGLNEAKLAREKAIKAVDEILEKLNLNVGRV